MGAQSFTPDERKVVQAYARRRGFKSLREYMRSLIARDAQEHGEALLTDEEPSHEEILAGIREGLEEALRGEGLPVETLWNEADDE